MSRLKKQGNWKNLKIQEKGFFFSPFASRIIQHESNSLRNSSRKEQTAIKKKKKSHLAWWALISWFSNGQFGQKCYRSCLLCLLCTYLSMLFLNVWPHFQHHFLQNAPCEKKIKNYPFVWWEKVKQVTETRSALLNGKKRRTYDRERDEDPIILGILFVG